MSATDDLALIEEALKMLPTTGGVEWYRANAAAVTAFTRLAARQARLEEALQVLSERDEWIEKCAKESQRCEIAEGRAEKAEAALRDLETFAKEVTDRYEAEINSWDELCRAVLALESRLWRAVPDSEEQG